MEETVTKYDIVNILSTFANDSISFCELNKALFPTKWTEVEKAIYSQSIRRAKYDPDCYCE